MQNKTDTRQKIMPVHIIYEYLAVLYSPHDDVVLGSGGIYAGFSGHGVLVSPIYTNAPKTNQFIPFEVFNFPAEKSPSESLIREG